MPRLFTLSFVALLGGLPLLSGCGNRPVQPKPAPPSVATVLVSNGTVHPSEQLPGVIAPTLSIAIQSDLTEPADTVNVKEGETVTRGETLAQLDTADLRAALAADLATAESDRQTTSHNLYQGSLSIDQGVDSLRSAQAAVEQARASLARDTTDLTRYRTLLANGYVAEQQVDQQDTTVRNDREALRSAQAALAAAASTVRANGTLSGNGLQTSQIRQSQATEQVALAQAQQERVEIAKATLVSPINGVVVNRNFNPGEYPGTRQLFTLQQIDPIYAILHASGKQIAHLVTDAPASIVVQDLGGRRFPGKVFQILNQVAPGSTDFTVEVRLRNPIGILRPGMEIEGTVDLPTLSGVRVPTSAFTDDTHTAVLAVDAKDTVRTVRVSEAGGDRTFAIVRGLTSGTRVVADGQLGLGDGEKIAVR